MFDWPVSSELATPAEVPRPTLPARRFISAPALRSCRPPRAPLSPRAPVPSLPWLCRLTPVAFLREQGTGN